MSNINPTVFPRKIHSFKLVKFYYYRDLKLLFMILFDLCVITFNVSVLGCRNLLKLGNAKLGIYKKKDKNKIIKYCRFCLHLRWLLGFKNTCLIYSILVCRMLRQFGTDAKINFCVLKQQKGLIGHCWVTVENNEVFDPYNLILRYP